MIEARQLTRSFSGRIAVDDVSFRVETGTIAAFLGPNGAGKTTTLRLLTGGLVPDRGTAVIAGHDVLDSLQEARLSFGYLPDVPAPSVIALNGLAAMEGLNHFMLAVTGLHTDERDGDSKIHLPLARARHDQRMRRDLNCPWCSERGRLARGEWVSEPRLRESSGHALR